MGLPDGGDADVFHEAVAGRGGRLNTASLEPSTAEGLDRVAERARGFLRTAAAALPRLPAIHFDFVDSWKFNAAAFRHDEKYFIGVHRGTPATLLILFDRMLADPEVLPFIGDAAEETTDLPLLPGIGLDFERSVAFVPAFPRPRDPTRRATAQKLAELALDFLTAHEFAHIANGHLDYQGTRLGISAIDEVGEPPREPAARERALVSQTMEMDADGTAAHLSLGSEWGKVVGHFPRPGPEWDHVYDRPGMVSLQWSWAVSSLFRLFGEARLTGGDVTLEPYPRPRLRSVMVQRAAGRVPRPQGLEGHPSLVGDGPHNIPPTVPAAQRDVEAMFLRLTGGAGASEGLDDAWGAVGGAQARRLQNYWRTKLGGELLAFAYQPLDSYGDPEEDGGNR